MKDITYVRWAFDQLFVGAPCVSMKVNAPRTNPGKKRCFLSSITMTPYKPGKWDNLDPGNYIYITFKENYTESEAEGDEQKGIFHGIGLVETLESEVVKERDCRANGNLSLFWKLNKHESFTDGAIRVGQNLFKSLDIRRDNDAKQAPWIDNKNLFSMFVVYKITYVGDGRNKERYDGYLRIRHKLPIAPLILRQSVL